MSHKVDIPEVTDFSDDLQEASTDMRSQLNKVKESIETINGMGSFSGKAAKEAKNYFGELHVTLLESFRGLFDDLEANLQQHLNTFESDVDVSESAIIKSSYLKEVKEDVNDVFEDLKKQDEIISETIQEVSDISSAAPPSFSDVSEWKKKTVKKLKELDEDLASFNSEGDETDVKEIMNQIETVMNSAKTSEGKARFADFEGASDGSALAKLKGYNEDKKEEQMEKAEDIKESTIKDLNKTSSKDVVNKAYQEFKDGDITYDQYTAIVNSVKKTSDNMSEAKIKENATDSFIEYLEDRGMLDDYLEEHATVAEQVKIENLDNESKGYLDRIEEAYKNGELNKADYKELRSVAINDGTTATEELLEEKLKDDDQSDSSLDGIIRVLNGGTSAAKQLLEGYIKDKGPEFIATNVNKWLAENTFHFVNLGGVAKFAGGGDNLVSLLPSISSDFIRTGAAHGVPIVGSIIDFGFQVADGEDPTDAVIKTGGHTGATVAGAAIGTAIGGPLGTFVGAAVGAGGSYVFDKIYDNKEKIYEGAKNFVGDALSGLTDGLGSIFS